METSNLHKAHIEINEASEQIFKSSTGSSGYHLCSALNYIIDEIEKINKILDEKTN